MTKAWQAARAAALGVAAVILALAWAPGAGAQTIDRDIATGSDDYGQFYGLTDPRIMFGAIQGYSANYGQGFRFTNITIPQGSTVTRAYISIVSNNNNWIGTAVRLTAIDQDNTATFSAGSPPGSRPITSSYIAAQEPDVSRVAGERVIYPTTAALQRTLGAAINAVVHRPGWSSGNAIALVNNSDQDPGAVVSFSRAEYRAYEYGSPAINGPKLHIEYTLPAFYSVGTNAAALYSGNASASAGTLTLASPAADDVGVGDEIRQGLNRYYIQGRSSSTVFTIQNSGANGGTPLDTNITFGSQAITIYRAFNSLSAANAGSSDANHLKTGDLVTGGFQLNWPCYDDGPMDDTASVTGWTTGPANYIRVYAPYETDEVGATQRHSGVAGTGFRLAPVNATPALGLTVLTIDEEYVRVEGIEIDGSGITNGNAIKGVVVTSVSTTSDVRISGCIVHDLHSTDPATLSQTYGISFQGPAGSGAAARLSDNIVYAITCSAAADNAHVFGIRINADPTAYVYHNTVYGIRNTGAAPGGAAWGIAVQDAAATMFAKNNYVGDVTSLNDVEFCLEARNGGTLNESYNVSSDGTAVGIGGQTGQAAYASYFRNATAGTEDLHLINTSLYLWGSNGTDLSGDANLPVTDDIDGSSRGRPDIGADEFVPTPRYRSVGVTGTALASGAGNALTISGSTAVFASGLPANIGIGDAIQYDSNGDSNIDALAFIHGRTDSRRYTVKNRDGAPPTAVAGDNDWAVYRAYTSLSSWQAQNENANIDVAVWDFDTSRDLVAGHGMMLVACYDDGPMDDIVNVSNAWITAPDSYIRIFTPVAGDQVGVSQRHNGVAASGFRLAPVINGAGTGRYSMMNLNTGYVRIEGIELDGTGVTASQFVRGITIQQGLSDVGDIRIDSNLIHDLHTTAAGWANEGSMGIIGLQQALNTGPPLTITNNFIYDITNTTTQGHIAGIHVGSRGTSYAYNNTVYNVYHYGNGATGGPAWGIYAKAWPNGTGTTTVIATNNYVGLVRAPFDPGGKEECLGVMENSTLTQSYNVSSDNTAAGTGSQINKTAYASYFQSVVNGSENLHLTAASSALAMFNAAGSDLSASFSHDIDLQVRTVAWDIGADEFDGTTAVKLMSFDATPGDGLVNLAWRTGSELTNLGFHLYRGLSANGPWTPLTTALIPGLGSSAVGQVYSFRDGGLTNGTRYFYRLEDVDASSKLTWHGPVSAVPQAVVAGDESDARGKDRKRKLGSEPSCPAWVLAAYAPSSSDEKAASVSCTRHGDPEAVSLGVLSHDSRQATLELRTGGFYALHTPSGAGEPAGTVRVFVPGFDTPQDSQAPALPLRRALVDAIVGRRVQLAGVRALDLGSYPGLVPSAVGSAEMQLAWDGTARAGHRTGHTRFRFAQTGLARLLPSVFQGETKSAVVELMPLRFDAARHRIVLARTLRVRLLFTGREPGESGRLSRGRRRAPTQDATGEVLARLFTTARGLYAASFEQLLPGERQALSLSQLSLERQRQPVAFHVEPDTTNFGPGSRLFFFADAVAASTAFSPEIAYELVRSSQGRPMTRNTAAPSARRLSSASAGSVAVETNRIYQPGLLDAADPWLWEALPSGATRGESFSLSGLDATAAQAAEIDVFLQGASESGLAVDHHLSVSLNGTPVGEAQFAGKLPYRISLSLPASLLHDGQNELSLTNVGDTGVASLVFLDRFRLAYPQLSSLASGRFEGVWSETGSVSLAASGAPAALVDVTSAEAPSWLAGYSLSASGVSFLAQATHRYLVASSDGLLAPRVAPAHGSTLRSAQNQADYILIASRELLPAAAPLLTQRRDQGLAARAIAFEDIVEEFGHGEPSAEAIHEFLAFAFHSWAQPAPRYVLLLGDSSYDPRNFMGGSPQSLLPALWTKTSYLWTASDPLLAAVNGEDPLPDLAIGRLPAANLEEASRLVDKLLAWEDSAQGLTGPATLVADDPDLGGDFEANVADIAQSFLAEHNPKILRLRELGQETRPRIQDALDSGLSWLNYVGHGGAAVWASENVWNSWDAVALRAQSRQPLLITMNCLNGYFVAPAYDSLAESLVKPEGRGAIAAFSPSGLSLDGPAHVYHRALMAEITSGRHARLGDALLAAQADYARSGLMPELLAVYHLFGDPAMVIQ